MAVGEDYAMLPGRYNTGMTDRQNFFGSSFDSVAFVNGFVGGEDVPNREAAAVAAMATLNSVTQEIRQRAGRDLGSVDEALKALAAETETSLTQGDSDQAATDLARTLAVVGLLQTRRDAERLDFEAEVAARSAFTGGPPGLGQDPIAAGLRKLQAGFLLKN
jgi:hypothetical protein